MNTESNDAQDGFESAKRIFGNIAGTGSVQASKEESLIDAGRRIMPDFLKKKWDHRRKVGHPLTVINRKAHAPQVTTKDFNAESQVIYAAESARVTLPPKEGETTPQVVIKQHFLIKVKEDGPPFDRAQWVEVVND